MKLNALLQRADIWRAGEHHHYEKGSGQTPAVATGCAALDRQLPGGGWPLGALSEILVGQRGIGELDLLLPALAQLTQAGRWVAWVDPPYIPYAPALAAAGVDLRRFLWLTPQTPADVWWTVEQSLRAGCCGAVVTWPAAWEAQRLRRLQLAAEAGHSLALAYYPASARGRASPAALRLQVEAVAAGLQVQVLKRRGAWPRRPVLLERPSQVPAWAAALSVAPGVAPGVAQDAAGRATGAVVESGVRAAPAARAAADHDVCLA